MLEKKINVKEIKYKGKSFESVEEKVNHYMNSPYTIIVERWDDGQGPYWLARVAELPHCIIHGYTPEEVITEIEEVKRDWIKSNLERGLKIPEPIVNKHSGQIRLRIPPSLHKMLANRALIEGTSLNQLMTSALASQVGLEYSTRRTNTTRKLAQV